MTTSIVTVIAGAITLLVLVVPPSSVAYRSPAGHLVVETVASMVAALVAFLLYGRFRQSSSLQHLMLAYALTVLSVAALGFVATPAVFGVAADSALTTWVPLALRVVGGCLILAAALVPGRRVGVRSVRTDILALGVLIGSVALFAAFVGAGLPAAVVEPPRAQSGQPLLQGHVLVLAAQAVLFVCFAAAAVLFTVQAEREPEDPLLRWLAAGAAVGACARLNYLIFPSLYSDLLYTGDLLRLGFYFLLLVGAVKEISAYWSAQAAVAASRERERLARELHDGVVQELGFIWSQSKIMARRPSPVLAERVLGAAERALDETRRAVDALAAPPDEPLAETLRRAACDVGNRYDVPLTLSMDASAEVAGDLREALVRIAREAVANAARHGKASVIEVRLRPGQLAVRDDGIGFDPDAGGRQGGYGLRSMRDRAEGAGARVVVDSAPERGTSVTVSW